MIFFVTLYRFIGCLPAYVRLSWRAAKVWQLTDPEEVKAKYPREFQEIRDRWMPKV